VNIENASRMNSDIWIGNSPNMYIDDVEEHEGICKVVLMEDDAHVHRGKVAKDWRENRP
jgi:hypothetical protein